MKCVNEDEVIRRNEESSYQPKSEESVNEGRLYEWIFLLLAKCVKWQHKVTLAKLSV